MGVVIVSSVVLAVLLLWALYTEPAPARRPDPPVRQWVGLPSPAEIALADFPVAPLGYDRRAVEAHLRAVADAFSAMRTAMAMSAQEHAPVEELAAEPATEDPPGPVADE